MQVFSQMDKLQSPVQIDGAEFSIPRRLSTEEIPQIVNDFRLAAARYVSRG